MPQKPLSHLWRALWLVLPLACGDDEGASSGATMATTNPTSSCPTAGCMTTGTSADDHRRAHHHRTRPDHQHDEETRSTTTTTTSTTGAPLECPFTPGCHKPAAPPAIGAGQRRPDRLRRPGVRARVVGRRAPRGSAAEAPRSIPMLVDLDGDGTMTCSSTCARPARAGVPRLGDGTFTSRPRRSPAACSRAGGAATSAIHPTATATSTCSVGDHVRGAYAWLTGPGLVVHEADARACPSRSCTAAAAGRPRRRRQPRRHLRRRPVRQGLSTGLGTAAGTWTESPGPDWPRPATLGHFQFADFDDDGDLDVFAFGEGGAVVVTSTCSATTAAFTEVADLPPGRRTRSTPIRCRVGRRCQLRRHVDIAAGGSIFLGQNGWWSLATAGRRRAHQPPRRHERRRPPRPRHPGPGVGLAVYLGDGTGAWFTPASVGLPDASYTVPGRGDGRCVRHRRCRRRRRVGPRHRPRRRLRRGVRDRGLSSAEPLHGPPADGLMAPGPSTSRPSRTGGREHHFPPARHLLTRSSAPPAARALAGTSTAACCSCALHGRQHGTRLSGSLLPPRERGITWSRVTARRGRRTLQ